MAKISTSDIVYVQLMDEGTRVYRPAPARFLSPTTAKLLIHSHYDPEDEEWEFKPGSIVKIAQKTLSGGERLVAVDLVSGERSSFLE